MDAGGPKEGDIQSLLTVVQSMDAAEAHLGLLVPLQAATMASLPRTLVLPVPDLAK